MMMKSNVHEDRFCARKLINLAATMRRRPLTMRESYEMSALVEEAAEKLQWTR